MVRAMKQSKLFLSRWAAIWVMAATSPLLFAQPPAQPAQSAQPPKTAAGADPAPPPSIDQTSYMFGVTLGAQLHRVGITNELSNDALSRGIRDGLNGREPTSGEMQQLQAYIRSVAEAAAARNRAAAADYLARNGREKGVVTAASGLEYKVIAAGDKKAPPVTTLDQVTVQYRGQLLDGTEFDSTYSRGAPSTFPVNGVIKGWQEALVLMKPGAKYRLFIPPDLAYGSVPKPKIPAGSLLIFDVEMISAQPPGTAAPTQPVMPMQQKK
jgi:FKBP-type peptidyl-prolyl cis-trans isomerase FklB